MTVTPEDIDFFYEYCKGSMTKKEVEEYLLIIEQAYDEDDPRLTPDDIIF